MGQKTLSGIITLLSIIGIIFISGCVQKECEGAVDCMAKTCFTAECTDNTCVYSPIADCCGNEICEINEIYPDCAIDCPNCDDKNTCTVDEYDYHEQECVNTPVLDVVCCGNSACEIGEGYSNCTRDCPNCNDDNECTEDSYDYHKQQCINKIILPCCGNDICDEDVETYSNCSMDCPNCDDWNELTADIFNYTNQTCENVLTHYFIDDFEAGITNWTLTDDEGNPIAWSTSTENGNAVLKTGAGLYWVMLENKKWDDYILKVKFKIVKGGINFNYRINSKGDFSRYIIYVDENQTALGKNIFSNQYIDLDRKNIQLAKNYWHTLEIRGYGNVLNIYIDGELLIKYKDIEDPILSGEIAFETFDESEFLIDDVEIKIITEKDVIYP